MKTLEEMGLTEDDLFKEKSLSYWKQLEQYQFIHHLAKSVGGEMRSVEFLVSAIAQDTQIANISLETLNRKFTVQQICEQILEKVERINEMQRFARAYSKMLEFPDET